MNNTEKLNVIVKAKTMALGQGIAEALTSSGAINILYVKEGDVDKSDWEACQENGAVVVFANVEKIYEVDTSPEEPWGTFCMDFSDFGRIEEAAKKCQHLTKEMKDRITSNIVKEAVTETLEKTVKTLLMLPRKGHVMTLAELLSV